MTEQDFITQAASLLARCSEEQRTRLSGMAQAYGKPDAGAQDHRTAPQASMSYDQMMRADPDYGKSMEERFPGINRLAGGQ